MANLAQETEMCLPKINIRNYVADFPSADVRVCDKKQVCFRHAQFVQGHTEATKTRAFMMRAVAED